MSNMVDYEKHFRMYCEGNSLTINLSFDMPKGYETANGTFDPTVNTLFINKEMLQSQPEYEQMFYLFHELRHALQYLHPESFDGLPGAASMSSNMTALVINSLTVNGKNASSMDQQSILRSYILDSPMNGTQMTLRMRR